MTSVADWRPPSVAWRAISIGLVCLLAVVFSVVIVKSIYVNQVINTQLARIQDPFPGAAGRPPAYTGGAATAQNVLLLGADDWNSVNGSLAGVRGQRSDTIMVVHIPANGKNVYVMSILRDSWVILPGGQPEKVNAALSYGGVPMAVQTVEGLIGARIDHVALVDYDGFAGLTDALDGVDINNPTAFTSSASSHVYPAGLQHLNGAEVLAFAREWRALPDGDFQRVRNQQLVMKAVLVKAMQGGALSDPLQIAALLGAVTPHVAVDEGLNPSYLTTLAAMLRNIREPDFVFFTAPTTGIGTSADGQSIVNLDWTKLEAVQTAFKTDALQTYQPELQAMRPTP